MMVPLVLDLFNTIPTLFLQQPSHSLYKFQPIIANNTCVGKNGIKHNSQHPTVNNDKIIFLIFYAPS